MIRLLSILSLSFLCLFLVSGCGKIEESPQSSNDKLGSGKSSSPETALVSFQTYFYKSNTSGLSTVLTNSQSSSWIQLSPTENNKVYLELYLKEDGSFVLKYFELQVGISDSNVLNEETIKGSWKASDANKISLSEIANLEKKTEGSTTTLKIGFLKDIKTAGLKNKITTLKTESRLYSEL